MRDPLFTDEIHFRAPDGRFNQVQEVAREVGQTASEYMRAAIRDRLSAEREERRPAA